jgi:hypothetical protein
MINHMEAWELGYIPSGNNFQKCTFVDTSSVSCWFAGTKINTAVTCRPGELDCILLLHRNRLSAAPSG